MQCLKNRCFVKGKKHELSRLKCSHYESHQSNPIRPHPLFLPRSHGRPPPVFHPGSQYRNMWLVGSIFHERYVHSGFSAAPSLASATTWRSHICFLQTPSEPQTGHRAFRMGLSQSQAGAIRPGPIGTPSEHTLYCLTPLYVYDILKMFSMHAGIDG